MSEALHAFLLLKRAAAAEEYRDQRLLYAIQAQYAGKDLKPPRMPRILR